MLLETKALSRSFGGITALNEVDLRVKKGLITGLIGPNGAGKTTLFNCITGLDTATSGKVIYKKKNITTLSAEKICRLSIARTFQNIRLFKDMSVIENVMVGRHFKTGKSPVKGRFTNALNSYFNTKNEEDDIFAVASDWLDFFNLGKYKNYLAKNLPYGNQRELEIARALATEPELLFLDEPAAGMNSSETESLMNTIQRISDIGVTVVLIEHDMKLIMNICDHITVLNYGIKIAEGTPSEVSRNKNVIEAYLGKEDD